MNKEKLAKDYPWLFSKKITTVVGKSRVYSKKALSPEIVDHGSFYTVTREKDASPLILSKNYG